MAGTLLVLMYSRTTKTVLSINCKNYVTMMLACLKRSFLTVMTMC